MKKSLGSNGLLKIVGIIVILAVAGYFSYRIISGWNKKAVESAVDRQMSVWGSETRALKEQIAALQEELRLQKEEIVSEEKLLEVFGQDAALIFSNGKIDCEVLKRQLDSLFSYFDQQDYIKAHHLENDTFALFQTAAKVLFEKPPVVIGETKDLFTLLQNMAYFYRILGKERLQLIQSILKNETGLVEPAMAIFYAWLTHNPACQITKVGPPAFKNLYDYAAFFTTTIAGRSYLCRRSARVKTLITYYSIQVLDQANQAGMNPYGIDVGRLIDALADDIYHQKGLLQQSHYLSTLSEMESKYQK